MYRVSTRLLVGLFAGFIAAYCGGCGGGGDSGGVGGILNPARDIRGTWVMSIPVNMTVMDIFCDTGPTTTRGTQDWRVTWIITGSEAAPFVSQTAERSNFIQSPDCSNIAGAPTGTFTGSYGTVSGTTLTLSNGQNVVGRYTFTTDLIMGTYDNRICTSGLCEGAYSGTNEFKLQRQK